MVSTVSKLILELGELDQTIEVRSAIVAGNKFKAALSQVNYPAEDIEVKEVKIVSPVATSKATDLKEKVVGEKTIKSNQVNIEK